MRTTVTLDPDVAEKLRQLAHKRRTSFKVTLNDVLRDGLARQMGERRRRRFVVEPHAGGFRPGIDSGRLNQLLDQMEVEAFVSESGSAP
jgi:hypothetical protein